MKKMILMCMLVFAMQCTCVQAQDYKMIGLSQRELTQDTQGLLSKKDFDSQFGDIDKQYLYYLVRYHKSHQYYYDFDLTPNWRKTGKIGVLGDRLIGLNKQKATVDLRNFEKESHGLALRTIAKEAFQTKTLKKVILPNTVTYVAPGAFGKAKVSKAKALQKQKDGSYEYVYHLKKNVKERTIQDFYNTNKSIQSLGGDETYRHRYQMTMRKGQTITLCSTIKVGKKSYVMPDLYLVYKTDNKAIVKITKGKMKALQSGETTISVYLSTKVRDPAYQLQVIIK